MGRVRVGMNSSKVPPAASRVFPGVTVQHLLPEAFSGRTNPVILPGDRGEVADDQERALGVIPFSEVRYDAMVGVFKVNPFKPIGGEEVNVMIGQKIGGHFRGGRETLFPLPSPKLCGEGRMRGVLGSSFEAEPHHSRRLWKGEGVTIHRNPFS